MEIELNKMALGDANKLKEIDHIPMRVETSRVRDLCPGRKPGDLSLNSWQLAGLHLLAVRYDETYTLYKNGGFKSLMHSVKRQLKKVQSQSLSFRPHCSPALS